MFRQYEAGAAFQPSPSSQSVPVSPSPSPSPRSPNPSLSVLAERKRDGIYKLTSTSSRSSSDKRKTSANPTPTHPLLHCKGIKRQLTHPAWGTTYCTIGSGEKGICAEKAPHWKTGISWLQVLHCTVLYSTVLLAIGRCTHTVVICVPQPGWALLASPPLSPLLLPPGHHYRKITSVHLHVYCARTQRDTVCCILYLYRGWPAEIFRGCSFVPLCLAGPFACLASPMT